ncbi:mRNA surveillance protein pelota [Candidatus Bathyarchaeota archaeon]|nr:mRNA surveillance protein pelota [Candidatus Bathyarchaeota archaeon]
MKILETNLKNGYVKVVPETLDDFWHLYNVIYKGDEVYAYTTRELKLDEKYARPKRGERISVFLGVKVENVVWDKLLGKLRIHGRICSAPENIPTGVYHTLSIALHTPMTIVKKSWSKHHLERLEAASKASEKQIIILSIDDEGYALATTAQYGVDIKQEERVKLPGKLETEKRAGAMNEFFRKTLTSLRQVWDCMHHPIIIIGVGFVKNDFAKFLRNEATDIAKSVMDVKSVNNGGTAGIYEALRSGILTSTIKKNRVIEETEIIEEILKRLGKGEATVTYGFAETEKAAKLGAVEKLVVADSTLRKADDEDRLLLERIMKEIEQKNGKIAIISTEHEAGAIIEFFRKTLTSLRQVWDCMHHPIIIIGVGFVKNDFAKFLRNEATDIAKSVMDVKSVNNGGTAGIYEALRSGILTSTIKKNRVIEETEIIEEILKRLGKGEATVTYGFAETEKAAKLGAVEKLVVADSTLRKADDEDRLLLERIMKEIEQKNGKIAIISTEHEAGAKLIALGGIGALLRYALPTHNSSLED